MGRERNTIGARATATRRTWYRRDLLLSTALAAGLGLSSGAPTAQAQSVITTGNVSPSPAVSPHWDVGGGLTVGDLNSGTLTIEGGGSVTSGISNVGNTLLGAGIVTVSGSDANGNPSTWSVSNPWVGNFGSGTLTVADGGLVSVLFDIDFGVTGTGTGTINIGGAAGQAAVAPGTLDTGIIRFGAGTGTLVFNHNGETTFTAGLVSYVPGTHAIEHHSGSTILTGDSSLFSGTTAVSGGTLTIANTLGGSASVTGGELVVDGVFGGLVDVQTAGVVSGTGTIVGLNITGGGVHSPGNSIGVQHITGSYANHGTLRIEATPTAADRIVVGGTIDITGARLDVVLLPTDASSWSAFGGPFIIIDNQSGIGVIGTFGSVTQSPPFLDTILDYAGGDGNDVTLELQRNNVAFAAVGATRNQIATGAAIDTLGAASPIWRTIVLASDLDVVRASFDALSGEIHASAKTALIEDSRFVRIAINDRLRAAFGSAGASPMRGAADPAGPGVWSYGFGSWGATGSDGNAARLDRATGGLLTGVDAVVGDWRVGLLTGYSWSQFDSNGRAASGASDNYYLGLYGGSEWGNLGFRSGLAYTWHDIDTRRAVVIPGLAERLTADYDAGTFQTFGELGYGMTAGASRLEPFANFAYVSLDTDRFTEEGGAAALSGSGTTDVAFTTLGLRADYRLAFGTADATLRGMIGWRHAFGDTTPESRHRFSAGGAFTIAGVPIAEDAAVIEAGLHLNLSPDATFGISYTGQIASDAHDHGLKADLAIRF